MSEKTTDYPSKTGIRPDIDMAEWIDDEWTGFMWNIVKRPGLLLSISHAVPGKFWRTYRGDYVRGFGIGPLAFGAVTMWWK
jgi:hypothetical protein